MACPGAGRLALDGPAVADGGAFGRCIADPGKCLVDGVVRDRVRAEDAAGVLAEGGPPLDDGLAELGAEGEAAVTFRPGGIKTLAQEMAKSQEVRA